MINIMIVLIVLFLVLVIAIAACAAFSNRSRTESLKKNKPIKSKKKVQFSDRVQVREFGNGVTADVGSISLNN